MIRSLNTLAIRNIAQTRIRTALSLSVVVLGVAMMIATNGFANAIRSSFASNEQAQTMSSLMITLIDTLLIIVNLVILLAAAFLIFNAFLMSVTERRQQIGMLRTLGMTQRQIMRIIVTEGLVIGILGTIIGLLIGPFISQGLMGLIEQFMNELYSGTGVISFSLDIMLIAALVGIGVSLLAVLVPAWNATRIAPLSALRRQVPSGIEANAHRRAFIALVVAIVLMLYLIFSPPGKWVQSPLDMQLSGIFILIWVVALLSVLPVLIELAGSLGRAILARRFKATGRLMADNLERERQRVMLTVITLAIGLTMIISMTGITQFLFSNLLLDVLSQRTERTTFAVLPFNIEDGMGAFSEGVSDLAIPESLLSELESRLEGIADVARIRITAAPELSPPLFTNSFTYVIDPHVIQATGDLIFAFSEGDWETAMPIMEAGCGLLVSPAVAGRYDAGIGDSIRLDRPEGAIDCTIAGIGASVGWATIISSYAGESFTEMPPLQTAVLPRIGADSAEVEAILHEVSAGYSNINILVMGELVDQMGSMIDSMMVSMNGILILAIFAAALGIINTTMMSVHERRHELGMIRAVGATRGQIRAIVMGEAALMGFVGAFLGSLAGLGMTVIFVVTYGGNSIGITDLALWPTALEVSQPALIVGVFGLIAAPLISAFAAWFPTRDILRGAAIETFNQRQ